MTTRSCKNRTAAELLVNPTSGKGGEQWGIRRRFHGAQNSLERSGQLQLHMLVLKKLGGRHQADTVGGENRLRVALTERLQAFQCLEEFWSDGIQRNFRIKFEAGLKVRLSEAQAGVFIQ